MADFDVEVESGASIAAWKDPVAAASYVAPAGALAPSRLNGNPAYPPRYYRVPRAGTLVVRAVVDGVHGPLDAALGGRLFQVWWSQWSGFPPCILRAAGRSSRATITFAAGQIGYYQLVFWREPGGSVMLPVCVEP